LQSLPVKIGVSKQTPRKARLVEKRPLALWIVGAALTGAYIVTGKLGLTLAIVNPSATAVWPPAGITLAALLVLGYRVWPAIFVGAFLVNLTTAGSVATCLGVAAGNTLEGLVGAYLVNRFAGGRHTFDRTRDVFKFAVLAAGLSTTVSSTIGVSSLCIGGFARWTDFGSIWTTWWLGDATGDLLVAPVCLIWADRRRLKSRLTPVRVIEAAALLLCLVCAGGAVFSGFSSWSVKHYPLEFLCVPPLLWAAFRFGRRESATAVLLLSVIAVYGTVGGFGPFRRDSVNESLLLLQAFLGVVSLTTISVSAAVSERRQLEKALSLMESAVRYTVEGVVVLASEWRAAEPRIIFANERFGRMTGRTPSELVGQNLGVLEILESEGVAEAVRRAFSRGEGFEGVARTRRADGSPYAVELGLTPAPSGNNPPTHWVGLVRDVSERIAHLEAIEHQALHDFLTGLPNRVLLRDRLEQAVLGTERERAPLALLLLDLDDFKEVNDTFGHQAGDVLLVEVGRRLKGALRSVDTVARLGGDEFAILLPTLGDPAAATRMAEKILEALEEPFQVESHRMRVSASIGIALCPQHGHDWETLLRGADVAMYVAKRSSDRYALATRNIADRRGSA
jgi:diguanylate cyclase (GGDEF)-like protein/PAS domain S-box-containing protein